MTIPTFGDISTAIEMLETLKKGNDDYWRTITFLKKWDEEHDDSRYSESKRIELWSDCVESKLQWVKSYFNEFNLYDIIAHYGTGKWRFKRGIDTMLGGGVVSAESDALAIDEIIKELETAKQNLKASGTAGDEEPAGIGQNKVSSSPKILGDTFTIWGLEIHWRVCWDKLKKLKAFIYRIVLRR